MVSREDVLKVCKRCLPLVDFEYEGNLIENGILDSLSLISLVSELSFEFDVLFDVESLTPDHFENVEAMAQFINQLKGN